MKSANVFPVLLHQKQRVILCHHSYVVYTDGLHQLAGVVPYVESFAFGSVYIIIIIIIIIIIVIIIIIIIIIIIVIIIIIIFIIITSLRTTNQV